jgi:hypothetical protein
MGTPRFGILTYPYPYRFGESHTSIGIPFFVFFFSRAQDRPFLTKQTTTQQNFSYPIFYVRDASGRTPLESARAYASPGRGAPRSSRVSARLRLDAPRQGGDGGGVGSDAVAGGAGADWATCLSLLESAAAAAADVARDGAAPTAASSARVGGGVSLFRAANTSLPYMAAYR